MLLACGRVSYVEVISHSVLRVSENMLALGLCPSALL